MDIDCTAVKHLWDDPIDVLHNFLGACHKQNSFTDTCPSTRGLHGLTFVEKVFNERAKIQNTFDQIKNYDSFEWQDVTSSSTVGRLVSTNKFLREESVIKLRDLLLS